MHSTTKLLAGICAAAFVASTAAAQTTSRDTTVRRTRHIAGSGIRVTKEGPETRTGTASGIYGGTVSPDTVSPSTSASTAGTSTVTSVTASPSASTNASSCTGVNCSPNTSANSGVNNNLSSSARADSSNNATVCTGTNCTGNSNMNANACMGTSCNSDSATYAGNPDMAMFGAPDPQFLQGMTDENILAHLAMGDSMEIRMAQHALQQTQNQQVRDFANTLIADHTASLRQDQAAAQQAGITPQLAVGDTAGMRMMDHMNMSNMSGNMSGNMNMSHGGMMAYSDANFVRHNVMMHRHMLSELQTLSGVAKNEAVRNKVNATIPVVQKHLTMAERLSTDLNR